MTGNPSALVLTCAEWAAALDRPHATMADRAAHAAGAALLAYVETRARKPVLCAGIRCPETMKGRRSLAAAGGALVLVVDDGLPGKRRGAVLCPSCTAKAAALPPAERASVADLSRRGVLLDLDRINGAPGLLDLARQPGAHAADEGPGEGLDAGNVVALPTRRPGR